MAKRLVLNGDCALRSSRRRSKGLIFFRATQAWLHIWGVGSKCMANGDHSMWLPEMKPPCSYASVESSCSDWSVVISSVLGISFQCQEKTDGRTDSDMPQGQMAILYMREMPRARDCHIVALATAWDDFAERLYGRRDRVRLSVEWMSFISHCCMMLTRVSGTGPESYNWQIGRYSAQNYFSNWEPSSWLGWAAEELETDID